MESSIRKGVERNGDRPTIASIASHQPEPSTPRRRLSQLYHPNCFFVSLPFRCVFPFHGYLYHVQMVHWFRWILSNPKSGILPMSSKSLFRMVVSQSTMVSYINSWVHPQLFKWFLGEPVSGPMRGTFHGIYCLWAALPNSQCLN